MASRKPAASTLLKAANAEVETLRKKVSDLEGNAKYNTAARERAESELSQIHEFLNSVPTPPPEKGADSYSKLSAMTRLSVWLATNRTNTGGF